MDKVSVLRKPAPGLYPVTRHSLTPPTPSSEGDQNE
jgi:hypothetical protein